MILSVAQLRAYRRYDLSPATLKVIWDNQSLMSAAQKRLAQRHPHLLWVANTRATIHQSMRKAVAERCGWRCVYCGIPLTTRSLTIDHIQPLRHGGDDAEDNLTAACRPCNSRKKDRPG